MELQSARHLVHFLFVAASRNSAIKLPTLRRLWKLLLKAAPPKPTQELRTLFDLLDDAAARHAAAGVLSYPAGDTAQGRSLTYPQLKAGAVRRARQIRAHPAFREKAVVLLHFNDHLDGILWFWATLFAGCIPAMSTPLSNDLEQRKQHLIHLHRLFEDPMCLTRRELVDQLTLHPALRLVAVEELERLEGTNSQPLPPQRPTADSIAALMLTSGSTGNSKAVCLRHSQMLASVAGKATLINLSADATFLNWVGMDHVAALLETHLEAMFLGKDQIHVQPPDVITKPIHFLELLSTHRVGRTFAPNFFLANLVKAVDAQPAEALAHLDLSALQCLVSGGESNPVRTVKATNELLCRFGAPHGAVFPGFGMTETCAGSIYNRKCPDFDLATGSEYASLGHCVPGIEMRITPSGGEQRIDPVTGLAPGRLEVRGPLVFSNYYKNPTATAEAFSDDGWFDTGDEAIIDRVGALHIMGRIKEVICINGVKFLPSDIEVSLNDAAIPGAVPTFFVCFAYRRAEHDTEQLCVSYLPSYDEDNLPARLATAKAITKKVMLQTGTFPNVLPLNRTILHKSTLGKLSRGKVKTAFLKGEFQELQAQNSRLIEQAQAQASDSAPLSDLEAKLLAVFQNTLGESLGYDKHMIGPDTPLLEVGMTSIHLIGIKKMIEARLDIPGLSIATLMSHSTVRQLAAALDQPQQSDTDAYDPVVTLQSGGSKTPLWLIHPGVGEVLVFLGLSAYIEDRPVYALRARGFAGETFFADIDETVRTYHAAIRRVQPTGPYALAGYSYGTMLAFETAKLLQTGPDPQRVDFLGSFNLPPHIKTRMRQLDWLECLLHLAFFLDLVPESRIDALRPAFQDLPRAAAVDRLLAQSAPKRVADLALTGRDLATWADLSFHLQSMARDYEPAGAVPCMDVFYCNPLQIVAASKQEWLANHMYKWSDFSDTPPRFHDVQGSHYTMIGPEHVHTFQKTLQHALAARGL